MKGFFAVVLATLLCLPAWAVEIPENCRVPNEDPGYCSWCSIETIARCNGINELYDLIQERKDLKVDIYVDKDGKQKEFDAHSGYHFSIRRRLDKSGLSYYYQYPGDYRTDLLKRYANKYGVVWNRKPLRRGWAGHAMVLTHFDDKKVKFWDPNHPEFIYTASREWFDYWWDGCMIAIMPPESEVSREPAPRRID